MKRDKFIKKRAVITGMGVVSPVGIGLKTFFQNIVEGRSGVDFVTRFDVSLMPTKVAAEVKDFEPTEFVDKKEARRMDRFVQFAMAAAQMAITDAKLDLGQINKDRVGVIMGCGIGGVTTFEEQKEVLMTKGPHRVSPFFVPMLIGNMAAGQISISYGFRGPSYTVQTACASSTNAIGEALKLIQQGEADVVVCGGTEASITPLAFAGFCSLKAMSTEKDNPKEACRPFDQRRSGFVMGEGSGILILESLEHAEKREASVYAELVGYGCTSDAYHITSPAPNGQGAAAAMRKALECSGLSLEDITYINAHGTGTGINDPCESKAIRTVFGPYADKIAVSSTKGTTGHLMGAAGAIEAIVSVLAIKHNIIPPTINYGVPDPECDLDYVPNQARRQEVKAVMSNTFGFGGHNGTLLFKHFAE